jgi:hypothetical protein
MIVLVLVRVAAVAVNAEVAFIPPPQATSNAGIKASAVIRIGVVRRIPLRKVNPKGLASSSARSSASHASSGPADNLFRRE